MFFKIALCFFYFFSFLFFPLNLKSQERLISLKPNITEIIFALGKGKDLVGVTDFCKRPPEAAKLPKVADYLRVDLEKVLNLKPDLVLASYENSARKDIELGLINRGIRVELLDFKTISQIKDSTLRLAKLLKQEEKGLSLVTKMQEGLDLLKKEYAQSPKRKALLVVGYRPLVVVGPDNFIDESLAYLNLENVAAKSGQAYPLWDLERILASQPEIIVDLSMGSEKSRPEILEERKAFWQRLSTLPAVKKNQVFFFDIEKLRAVPTLPEALEDLAKLILKKSLS
ncbi:MAG: ABC transporter substrate-binding protein [Deltaproteobacteria bacterium]|nr:ABC transporter substrate-binding protein [Deltaproteobacteria bacterium]